MFENAIQWLNELEWHRVIPEIIGKGLGFLAGFGASWFLLFRRQLKDLQRLQSGDSDDVIFQMHQLCPVADNPQQSVLVFRNVVPNTTVNKLYDNPAARKLVREMADATSMNDPVLQSKGTTGFEVLNDALGYAAGQLAISPFDRENWLFMMTCEDRQIVRKKCVRCFLIRPNDLTQFVDWNWCMTHIQVEKPGIGAGLLHSISSPCSIKNRSPKTLATRINATKICRLLISNWNTIASEQYRLD